MPDLQFTTSNVVYKEFKVLQTSALLESGCCSAQLAVLFLLSRAFRNISHIEHENNCVYASKHHLDCLIRSSNVLWWIYKPTWFCPLLFLALSLWMKSTFYYKCIFWNKQTKMDTHKFTNSITVRRHWWDFREWKRKRSGLHKASEYYCREDSHLLLNTVHQQKYTV